MIHVARPIIEDFQTLNVDNHIQYSNEDDLQLKQYLQNMTDLQQQAQHKLENQFKRLY